MLEDLGSTNGTYVNGQKIAFKIAITKRDSVTVGQTVPMPWPDEEPAFFARTFRIGREPDNDFVVNLPIVSAYHARLVWDPVLGAVVIEDLKSSNGTALGSLNNKITRSILRPEDTIFLGTHAVPADQVLMRFDPALAATLPLAPVRVAPRRDLRGQPHTEYIPTGLERNQAAATEKQPAPPIETARNASPFAPVDGRPSPSSWEDLAGELRRTIQPVRPLVLLLAHALVASLLVRFSTAAVAASLFWLGFASIWLGLSNVLIFEAVSRALERALDAPASATTTRWAARFLVLAGVSLAQSILLWAVVCETSGAVIGDGATLGLVVVAAGVGLACGLAIVALLPRAYYALAALPLILFLLWFLGGEQRPVAQLPSWARAVSNVVPSRWAFEGLLLLESDRRSSEAQAVGIGNRDDATREPATDRDIAEDYFPVDSERMGVKADAIALIAMFAGLTALSWFTVWASPPATGGRLSSAAPDASKPRGALGSGYR